MPSGILSSLVNTDRESMRVAWSELIQNAYIRHDMYMTLIDLDLYLNKEEPTDFMVKIYGSECFPLSLGLYEEDVECKEGRRLL